MNKYCVDVFILRSLCLSDLVTVVFVSMCSVLYYIALVLRAIITLLRVCVCVRMYGEVFQIRSDFHI